MSRNDALFWGCDNPIFEPGFMVIFVDGKLLAANGVRAGV